MRPPSLSDAVPREVGDTSTLFVGGFNPPNAEHRRAIFAMIAAAACPDPWIAPMPDPHGPGGEHVIAMCQIFCASMALEHGVPLSCCTVGIDKGMGTMTELLNWFKVTYPGRKVRTACIASDEPPFDEEWTDVVVKFPGQTYRVDPPGPRIIDVSCIPPVGNIVERIRAGGDESRSTCPGVWAYIQKNRLYRS